MLKVDLLVPSCSAPSTLMGMFDVLCAVGRDWETIVGEGTPSAAVRPRFVAETLDDQEVRNGIFVRPHATLESATDADVVIVPDLMLEPSESLRGQLLAESAWLARRYASGAVMASVCTGSLLLAEAGLLDGQEATTHWAVQHHFARDYPLVKLHAERVLVAAGDGERIVTAGGGSSWHDLLLYLIARLVDPVQSVRIAKLFLMQYHGDSQLPYARATINSQHSDRVIAEAQAWVSQHYACAAPVSAMAQRSGLTERTFKRRFKAATGMPPIAYVHNLRVEEAKQMLEGGDASVESIAVEVGYDDPTFFRRLFKRKTALSPAEYRRRFQPIARIRRASLARAAAQPRMSVAAAPSEVVASDEVRAILQD